MAQASPSTPLGTDAKSLPSLGKPAWDPHDDEDESFEVQVPDFHFDWGVEDPSSASKNSESSGGMRSAQATQFSLSSLAQASPSTSSASSNRFLTRADNSISSASSALPTPPSTSVLGGLGKRAEQTLASASVDDIDMDRPLRALPGRGFQRVVSAPVGGARAIDDGALRENAQAGCLDLAGQHGEEFLFLNQSFRRSTRQQVQSWQRPQTDVTRSYLVNGAPYERLGMLGKGGSSKVYSVLCPSRRTVYALKRVLLDRADAETYQSYTNEIELLRRLRGDDRIIQLIDHQITFSQGNRPRMLSMVMECGEIDFAALLDEQRGKPLNLNFVGLYWQQMLEAVQAVHAENVVHTDLKPANFVLVKGRLKIIDFGIAKAIANDTVNIQREQQVGTVNYMSPEAIQRMNNQKVLKLSYPSDVWSLGCILYQMIYGGPPFQHISAGPLAKMNAIADPSHRISYPPTAVAKMSSLPGQSAPNPVPVVIPPAAISTMRSCLAYNKDNRMTIPELLQDDFLTRKAGPAAPPNSTSITESQMAMLVNFVLRENGLPALGSNDRTAEDLFSQLQSQNSLSQS
ncbi:Serine/threonine kinase mps1 [Vanrija albida]|uniref:Serine/threonine kinase mps1 n=1 Tax=Vanrija albida TaxID=181172 RepID=A0ABR3PUC3_9TREE